MLEKNVMGSDGLFWAIGVVEDRQDPLALGRVRARAYGIHSASLSDIPTNALPWAQVVASETLELKESDTVLMFFADGRSSQVPIILAKLQGFQVAVTNQGQGFNDTRANTVLQNAPRKPQTLTYAADGSGIKVKNANTANVYPLAVDLNKQSLSGATRFDIANTVIQQRINNLDKGVMTATGLTWDEPYPAYNPLYPYNNAVESESGHIVEVDDTPGNERLAWTHRAGSFIEFYPSGSRVQKITKSNYTVVLGDDYIHVMGRVLITVGENAYIKVLGDTNLETNNLNAGVSGDANFSVKGAFNVKAGSVSIASDGSFDMKSSGDLNTQSGGNLNLKGNQVLVGGGSYASMVAGTVQLDGYVTIEEGGQSPGGASAASVPAAPGTTTPNSGVAGHEPTPVLFQQSIQYLNNATGAAYKQNQLLNSDGTTPDSNANTVPCSFDPNVHTFLSSPWTISVDGLNAIKQREGLGKILSNGMIQAYQDPPGTNSYSIGYGTSGSVCPITIDASTIITKAQAEQFLESAINDIFIPKIQEFVTVDLTQHMVDALVSFVFNIGYPHFSNSQVLKFTNQEAWCSAGQAFLLWNKIGSVPNAGLTGRRQTEKNQFLS